MVKRAVLAALAATTLCGCEALIAATVLAELGGNAFDGPSGPLGPGGFGPGGMWGGADAVPVQDGYLQGRIAEVSVNGPTDVLQANGGSGYVDVYSEVSRANGGAIMSMVTFYSSPDDLDAQTGTYRNPQNWNVGLIGCSGPSSGNWTNEGTVDQLEIEVEETVVTDGSGEEVPATEVVYEADFRDWDGEVYSLDGRFTLVQP